MESRILILDYGSPYTQQVARRIREERVYCEIHPARVSTDWIRSWAPRGIVLSGGAAAAGDRAASLDPEVLRLGIPVLGIGYGMQLIAVAEGGSVEPGAIEPGRGVLTVVESAPLFDGFPAGEQLTVWRSGAARVAGPPPGYGTLATMPEAPVAAFGSDTERVYGVAFHPEVAGTPRGDEILSNFIFKVCGAEPTWTAGAFIEEAIDRIHRQVGNEQVICGLSGGVDSSVAAALVHRAIGDRLTCIFVDTGLLRKGERESVERTFRSHLGVRLEVVDASRQFLEVLRGVTDPEVKRKRIGETFISVFERAALETGRESRFLVQGT